MPIYEYQCQACLHEMEVLQKISDPPIRICPECDADKMVKKVSRTSFRLKGSGWYETDFKDPPKAKQTQSASNEETSASSNQTTTTQSDSVPTAPSSQKESPSNNSKADN